MARPVTIRNPFTGDKEEKPAIQAYDLILDPFYVTFRSTNEVMFFLLRKSHTLTLFSIPGLLAPITVYTSTLLLFLLVLLSYLRF